MVRVGRGRGEGYRGGCCGLPFSGFVWNGWYAVLGEFGAEFFLDGEVVELFEQESWRVRMLGRGIAGRWVLCFRTP